MKKAVGAAEQRKACKAASSGQAEQLRKSLSLSSLKFQAALASSRLSNRIGEGLGGLGSDRVDLEDEPKAAHVTKRSAPSGACELSMEGQPKAARVTERPALSDASKLSSRLADGLGSTSFDLEAWPTSELSVDLSASTGLLEAQPKAAHFLDLSAPGAASKLSRRLAARLDGLGSASFNVGVARSASRDEFEIGSDSESHGLVSRSQTYGNCNVP